MTDIGIYRVYFNRHGAAPLVWCVAPAGGGWELAVAVVNIRAPVISNYEPKPEKDEDDGRPSAWFEVRGVLAVKGSVATIGPIEGGMAVR